MFEHLAEAGEFLAALLLTVAGAFAELNAVGFADDSTVIALWLAYMGAIALYAGLFVVGGGLLGQFSPSPE